jgi:hypothetical protein
LCPDGLDLERKLGSAPNRQYGFGFLQFHVLSITLPSSAVTRGKSEFWLGVCLTRVFVK